MFRSPISCLLSLKCCFTFDAIADHMLSNNEGLLINLEYIYDLNEETVFPEDTNRRTINLGIVVDLPTIF